MWRRLRRLTWTGRKIFKIFRNYRNRMRRIPSRRISAIRTTLIRLFTATGSVEDLRNTLISTRGNPHYCLYNSQQGGIKLIAELYQNQVRYFSPTIDFLGSNEPPGPSLPLAISIFNSTENPTLPPAADALGITAQQTLVLTAV